MRARENGLFFYRYHLSTLMVIMVVALATACQPQVSLQVDKGKIRQGEQARLTWTSKNAKAVSINGEPVGKSGSKTVSPRQTTSYEALAKRGKKEARAFVRVEVDIPTPAPRLTFSADRSVIRQGQTTTLRWSSTNAESVRIPGLGRLPGSGSRDVSPTNSTTYTATATGPGGTDTKSVRVTVNIPEPPKPKPKTTYSRNPAREFARMIHIIYYAFDSAELTDETQARLRSAAGWLNQPWNRSIRFRVEGHCDERGTEEYNIGLGDRRANAARDFLIGQGVAPERIETISWGEARPADPGHNEQAWAKNRRDEFIYLEGGDTEVPLSARP